MVTCRLAFFIKQNQLVEGFMKDFNGQEQGNKNQQSLLVKWLVFGDTNKGKNSLVAQSILANDLKNSGLKGLFSKEYPGIGIKFIETKELKLSFQLWNFPGEAGLKHYFNEMPYDASAALLIWDPSQEKSFLALREWLLALITVLGNEIPIIFVPRKLNMKEAYPENWEALYENQVGTISIWMIEFVFKKFTILNVPVKNVGLKDPLFQAFSLFIEGKEALQFEPKGKIRFSNLELINFSEAGIKLSLSECLWFLLNLKSIGDRKSRTFIWIEACLIRELGFNQIKDFGKDQFHKSDWQAKFREIFLDEKLSFAKSDLFRLCDDSVVRDFSKKYELIFGSSQKIDFNEKKNSLGAMTELLALLSKKEAKNDSKELGFISGIPAKAGTPSCINAGAVGNPPLAPKGSLAPPGDPQLFAPIPAVAGIAGFIYDLARFLYELILSSKKEVTENNNNDNNAPTDENETELRLEFLSLLIKHKLGEAPEEVKTIMDQFFPERVWSLASANSEVNENIK